MLGEKQIKEQHARAEFQALIELQCVLSGKPWKDAIRAVANQAYYYAIPGPVPDNYLHKGEEYLLNVIL